MRARVTVYHDKARMQARRISVPKRQHIAEQIAADARSLAPRLTSEYAESFSVETSGTQVRVVSNDDTAIHKEYGTSDTPAHASLTNAAARYGRYSGTRPRGRR